MNPTPNGHSSPSSPVVRPQTGVSIYGDIIVISESCAVCFPLLHAAAWPLCFAVESLPDTRPAPCIYGVVPDKVPAALMQVYDFPQWRKHRDNFRLLDRLFQIAK